MQAAVNKIYNLALENNLGKDIIFEWQQHVIVVQSLVDNLAHKSHKTALKDLKKVFGGTRGLNEDNRRLVDSILRNSQREEPVVQQVVHAPMLRNGPRYGPPWGTNRGLQFATSVNYLAILLETVLLRDPFTNLNLSDLHLEEGDEEDSSMMSS